MNSWLRVMGKLPSCAGDFDEFRRRATLAPSTVEAIIGTVRRHSPHDLGKGKRLKIPPPSPWVPSLDDLSAMYRNCRAADWPCQSGGAHTYPKAKWLGSASRVQWWRAFIVFAAWTGLRLGDLKRVTWEHWDQGELPATSKVGSPVPLVASSHVERHLAPLRGLSDSLFVQITPKPLRRGMAQICERAKIKYITPQVLRCFAITEWSLSSDAASSILHGCGVRKHYLDRKRIMENAAGNVRIPSAFLTASERTEESKSRRLLLNALRRASPKDRAWLVETAKRVG